MSYGNLYAYNFPVSSGGGDGNATSIQGVPVSATPPTTGQILEFNGSEWVPATLSVPSVFDATVANTGADYTSVSEALAAFPDQAYVNLNVIGDCTETEDYTFTNVQVIRIVVNGGVTWDLDDFTPFGVGASNSGIYIYNYGQITYEYTTSKAVVDCTSYTDQAGYVLLDGGTITNTSTANGCWFVQGAFAQIQRGVIKNCWYELPDTVTGGMATWFERVQDVTLNGANSDGPTDHVYYASGIILRGNFDPTVGKSSFRASTINGLTNLSGGAILNSAAANISNIYDLSGSLVLNTGNDGTVVNATFNTVNLSGYRNQLTAVNTSAISYSAGTAFTLNMNGGSVQGAITLDNSALMIFSGTTFVSSVLVQANNKAFYGCNVGQGDGTPSETITLDIGVDNCVLMGNYTAVAIVDNSGVPTNEFFGNKIFDQT